MWRDIHISVNEVRVRAKKGIKLGVVYLKKESNYILLAHGICSKVSVILLLMPYLGVGRD